MTFRFPRFRSVLAVLVAVAAIGCSDGAEPTRDGRAEDQVVLVTYAGYALPEEAAKAFTDRTGITIEVRTFDDAGTALSQAILTAPVPEGDVLFGVDNTMLTRATSSEAFEAHQASSVRLVDPALRLDPTGTFTPIDYGDVCVNADTEWFARRGLPIPEDFEDLADPRYRDLLVVQSPITSSPGLSFLVATRMRYGDRTDDYWRRLRANGVVVANSWDDAWNARYSVNGGQRPLVVSYATSPPAEVIFSDGTRTEPASTVITSTCFRQVEFAGILAGAKHPRAARRLIEEMLSERWQEALPLTNFVYPARRGVELPVEFRRWATPVPDPITATPQEIGRSRDAWIDAWRRVME